MAPVEYLLRFGARGDLGRFRAGTPLDCGRGDRVVVRAARGLELAEVVHPLRLAAGWADPPLGEVVRPATTQDEATAVRMAGRARDLYARGCALAHSLALPVEVLDAEVLLDGQHGALHHVRLGECDIRPLVSTLARE